MAAMAHLLHLWGPITSPINFCYFSEEAEECQVRTWCLSLNFWRNGFIILEKALKMCAGIRVVSLPCLLMLMFAASVFAASSDVLVIDDFNEGLSPNWKSKKFKGVTQYSIADLDGESVLMAFSSGAASALIYKKEYSLRDYPVLSWRWRVDNILPKGDARTKDGDDYSARIYVIFPHWIFPLTRSINYIWANKLPKGEYLSSSYTGNSVLVAVQSGPENIGHWITERRNVRDDYLRIFGEEPRAVGAIAIMTDADNTEDEARAWYDDIRIEKE